MRIIGVYAYYPYCLRIILKIRCGINAYYGHLCVLALKVYIVRMIADETAGRKKLFTETLFCENTMKLWIF